MAWHRSSFHVNESLKYFIIINLMASTLKKINMITSWNPFTYYHFPYQYQINSFLCLQFIGKFFKTLHYKSNKDNQLTLIK